MLFVTYFDRLETSVYLAFGIGFTTAYYAYKYWKYTYWSRNGIPGPILSPLPIIGRKLQPNLDNKQELIANYGKTVGIAGADKLLIITSDPEFIKTVCIKEFNYFQATVLENFQTSLERKFLFFAHGDEWKRLRTLLTPIFTSGRLRKIFELLELCMKSANEYIEKEIKLSKHVIDLKDFWSKYSTDVTAKYFFSCDIDPYSGQAIQVLEAVEQAFKSYTPSFWIRILPAWVRRALGYGIFKPGPINMLHSVVSQIIANHEVSPARGRQTDFVYHLKEIQKQEIVENSQKYRHLTHDEIVASSLVFFTGGNDTTKSLLLWASWELVNHPEIQEKLYQEVSILDKITYDSVQTCVYLEAVINETLRLHPPAPVIARTCVKDYLLPNCQGVIPKGTVIGIEIEIVQTDPDNFPDPFIFNPNRFLPGNKEMIKPSTFIPFGAGPRACIGNRFALNNAKFALASVLKKYRLSKLDDMSEQFKVKIEQR